MAMAAYDRRSAYASHQTLLREDLTLGATTKHVLSYT
jgi:hypothetical protein